MGVVVNVLSERRSDPGESPRVRTTSPGCATEASIDGARLDLFWFVQTASYHGEPRSAAVLSPDRHTPPSRRRGLRPQPRLPAPCSSALSVPAPPRSSVIAPQRLARYLANKLTFARVHPCPLRKGWAPRSRTGSTSTPGGSSCRSSCFWWSLPSSWPSCCCCTWYPPSSAPNPSNWTGPTSW